MQYLKVFRHFYQVVARLLAQIEKLRKSLSRERRQGNTYRNMILRYCGNDTAVTKTSITRIKNQRWMESDNMSNSIHDLITEEKNWE